MRRSVTISDRYPKKSTPAANASTNPFRQSPATVAKLNVAAGIQRDQAPRIAHTVLSFKDQIGRGSLRLGYVSETPSLIVSFEGVPFFVCVKPNGCDTYKQLGAFARCRQGVTDISRMHPCEQLVNKIFYPHWQPFWFVYSVRAAERFFNGVPQPLPPWRLLPGCFFTGTPVISSGLAKRGENRSWGSIRPRHPAPGCLYPLGAPCVQPATKHLQKKSYPLW